MYNLKVMNYVLLGNFTQDYSLGNSFSDDSERLFQRGRGGGRIYKSFLLKKKYIVEHQKITANHRNRHLKLMILVLFYVWEDARVWDPWSYSFDMNLNYLGPVPCFSSPWIPLRVHSWRGLQWLKDWWWQLKWQVTFFSQNCNWRFGNLKVGVAITLLVMSKRKKP